MLVPNTNTRARCTGDDESAPKTRDSTLLTYYSVLQGVSNAVVYLKGLFGANAARRTGAVKLASFAEF